MSEFVKLTVAQAIVKYLENQWIEIDGSRLRLCGGGFGIFGHGNVTCLGEALFDSRDTLPLFRGQHEGAWASLRPLTRSIGYGNDLCFVRLRPDPAQLT